MDSAKALCPIFFSRRRFFIFFPMSRLPVFISQYIRINIVITLTKEDKPIMDLKQEGNDVLPKGFKEFFDKAFAKQRKENACLKKLADDLSNTSEEERAIVERQEIDLGKNFHQAAVRYDNENRLG